MMFRLKNSVALQLPQQPLLQLFLAAHGDPGDPAPAAKPAAPAGAQGSVVVKAPMPGTVVNVVVSAGQAVKAGDDLVFIEAMKMETPVKAPQDGTVATVDVAKGESVDSGKVLVTLN